MTRIRTLINRIAITAGLFAIAATAAPTARADVDLAAAGFTLTREPSRVLVMAHVRNNEWYALFYGTRNARIVMEGWDWVWHWDEKIGWWGQWEKVHEHLVIESGTIHTLFGGFTYNFGFYGELPWAYSFPWARYRLELSGTDYNPSNERAWSDWVSR
jgi:hypothetical protein